MEHHPDIVAFIQAHLEADLNRLLLSAARYPQIDVPYIVGQIEALRKVREKLPAWYDPRLRFPPRLSVEQASSEVTAQFKAQLFSGGKMADLTGGLGVDTFYWAKSFESVTYVEQQPELVGCAEHNFQILAAGNIQCVQDSAESFLQQNTGAFDLLYLDPARRGDRQQRLFQLADCSPNVLVTKDLLLEKSPRVLLKTAPLLDITQALRDLGTVSQVWVLAHKNECKEVLYLLERNAVQPDRVPIQAVDLGGTGVPFTFTMEAEKAAQTRFSEPLQYLYEPDAALMKAGAFKVYAERYGLSKLHVNTHLYTSDQRVTATPGRHFKILQVCKYDKKAIQTALGARQANVAARNFPDTADKVRQTLGLKDGGDCYLFACTLADQRKVVLLCEKA